MRTIERLRAAGWALWAAVSVTAKVRRRPLPDVTVPRPPPVGDHATVAVRAALRLTRRTCLVRSLVLQEWEVAHGSHRDLVIGVTPPSEGFEAHAWLDGDPLPAGRQFTPLLRRAPRAG